MQMRSLEDPEPTDPTHSHKMSIFIFFFLLFYKFNRKGTVPRNFWLQVFSWISFPQDPEYTIRLFQICSKIHGDIRNSRFTTGVRHRWQIKKSSIRKFFTADPGSRGKKKAPDPGSRIHNTDENQCCGSMTFWCGSGSGGSMPLTNGSGSCYFRLWPQDDNKKQFFLNFSAYYFLKVHLHNFSKVKSQKEVTKQ